MATTKNEKVEPVDMKLKVVVLGVSDVDRAKAFYQNLGWRLDASTSQGRRDSCRTPPRDSGAPQPLREDACRAPLVGLVRALPERARERQQSGGGSSSRRPLHGGGPSCSSPMTPFEWLRSPSGLGSST